MMVAHRRVRDESMLSGSYVSEEMGWVRVEWVLYIGGKGVKYVFEWGLYLGGQGIKLCLNVFRWSVRVIILRMWVHKGVFVLWVCTSVYIFLWVYMCMYVHMCCIREKECLHTNLLITFYIPTCPRTHFLQYQELQVKISSVCGWTTYFQSCSDFTSGTEFWLVQDTQKLTNER